MTGRFKSRQTPATRMAWPVMLGALALTLLAYWPALYGGYIFDDGVYFVNNPDVHVKTLQLGAWIRAALSQSGINPLMRPLSALTFAANYYLTGPDPFWPKLTNVCIHLLNGVLIFLVLREMFQFHATVRNCEGPGALAAAVIAGLWLLLPINLTGVAYVSQRMEALATAFVFLGLLSYIRARRLHYTGEGSAWWLGISLALFTALGLTAKEDAALLPLYAASLEFALTGFRERDGRWSRAALWTYFGVLVVPLIAGLAWLAPRILHGVSSYRNFTLGERLLTEPRVLVSYIDWTLLPNLNSLTFYHDDLLLSHGLLDPPTTLPAIVALLSLLSIAIWRRNAQPLFCLGVLWFFAGHSMTATVVPLELVFEHRNYFPSVGLLLATASLLAFEPGLPLPSARTVIATGFALFFAFTTFLRAQEWSDPIRLAYSEALKRPESQRAQYDLAQILIIAAGENRESPLITEAQGLLERTAFLPNTGITPLQALIYLDGRAKRPIDPRYWQTITTKLRDNAPSQSDVAALIFLSRCQLRGECPVQKPELLEAFVTALTRSGGNPNLLGAYGEFALKQLGDLELAERMYREAVATSPKEPVYRANLVRFLIATGQPDAAALEIDQLAALNHLGSLDDVLAPLRAALAAARVPEPDTTSAELPQRPSNR
jgi:hypothetical protein